jgi:hypothetical protein
MSSGQTNIQHLKSQQISPSRSAILTTLFMLIVISWDILHGQVRQSRVDVVGQTVPGGVGEGGTVPIRISPLFDVDSTQALNPILDRFDIRLLQIEIAKAELRVNETNIWTRIIPQVHISASFGMHDIMFVDPTTFTSYILPRDAYRLSVSVSLNDVLSSCKHTQALLELEQLRTEETRRTMKQLQSRKSLEQQLLALRDQAALLDKELALIKELLHFNELRFQQGKIEFDALTRTRLELLGVEKALRKTRLQLSSLQSTSPLFSRGD